MKYLKYTQPVLILILAIIVCLLWLRKQPDSEETILLRQERERLKTQIDSVRTAYDKIISEKDAAAQARLDSAVKSSDLWHSIAKQSERDLKHERNNRRAFSDHATDSLLSTVR